MARRWVLAIGGMVWLGVILAMGRTARAQIETLQILPEQRQISIRDATSLPSAPIPDIGPPHTVAEPDRGLASIPISLDEAIRTALKNAEVIRVLTGVSATTSGRTIYDVAIDNTAIDEQNSVFDPALDFSVGTGKVDQPSGPDLTNSFITGSSSDAEETSLSLTKRMFNGADFGLAFETSRSRFEPGLFPLDPEGRAGWELSWRQPILRGYGRAANLAPIVVARIDTERSYFQFKDSTQELIRGVIEAYWALVAARVEVWARQQQVEQSEFGFERANARKEEGLTRAADVAQARSALANFRADLISARSNQILAETALRNILKLDPSSDSELVPTTAPLTERVPFDWRLLLATAEKHRPDIVELKLIIEADQLLLVQADNQARPQLDGVATYRWDGLRGELPGGAVLESDPGQFAGYNVGVNFSVPLGLRQSRAALRRQELVLRRDQANLDQGLHQMVHQLAVNYRNLDQFFQQIDAFREARDAARINYQNQVAEFISGRQNFLNVLDAITAWGNAVSQEARSVTQYNTELANVERESGTILESHGIVFAEERYSSISPLGRTGRGTCYPSDLRLGENQARYPDSGKPAEDSFDLRKINLRESNGREGPVLEQPPPAPPVIQEAPEPKSPPPAKTRAESLLFRQTDGSQE
jgi:outer membrane protein TolC